MRTEIRRARRRRWLAAAAATAMLTLTAACGDDGDSDSDSAENDAASFKEYQLEFAECMRDHGVNFPDPESDDDKMSKTLKVDDQQAFEKASTACEDELGPRPADPDAPDMSTAEMNEIQARFHKCLRDNGVDIPKAPPGGGAAPAIPRDTDPKVLEECDESSREGME